MPGKESRLWIYGPRRSGRTTLAEDFAEKHGVRVFDNVRQTDTSIIADAMSREEGCVVISHEKPPREGEFVVTSTF